MAERTANLIIASDGYGFGASIFQLNYNIYSGYFSDQWRVLPNLTLNLGLRYDLYTPLHNPQRRYLEPIFPDPNNIFSAPTTGGFLDFIGRNAGADGNFFHADKNN